jgi:hypothetical protein
VRGWTIVIFSVVAALVAACGDVIVPDPCEDSAPVGEMRVLLAPPEPLFGTVLRVGETLDLDAEVAPVAGAGTDLGGGGCRDYYGPSVAATISWRSSSGTVATVDAQGVVTTRAVGSVVITARDAARGIEASREIEVQAQ